MGIGRSINRVDAVEKVTGNAKYTDDLTPRNALEANSTFPKRWQCREW